MPTITDLSGLSYMQQIRKFLQSLYIVQQNCFFDFYHYIRDE